MAPIFWAEAGPRLGELISLLQKLQKRIVTERLPDPGYEWAQALDVEVYLSAPGAEESQFQLWLPIQKTIGK